MDLGTVPLVALICNQLLADSDQGRGGPMAEDLKNRVVVLFVMAIIAFVPSVGHSQGLLFGSVDGLVRIRGGDTGTIRVQLEQPGMIVQEQFSADGHFTFGYVPYGQYTLSIRLNGHEPVSQEISVPG